MKSKINNCTAANPMPKGRDQMGQHWYHHGAAPVPGQPAISKIGDSAIYRCAHCGHEFPVTARRRVTSKQAIADVASMRARGWRPERGMR